MLQDYSIERLADRQQIQDVLYRWCRAIDRLDYDAIRNIFHPDAIDSHGHYEGNIDGFIEWVRGRHATIPFCLHSLSNMLIEFASLDTAIVETNVMTVQHYPKVGDEVVKLLGAGRPGAPMDMIAFARYADRFERRKGEWRIQRRTVIYDAQMILESCPSRMSSGVTLGRRDKDDFIYKLRMESGL
jgi:hypothetical protein